MCEIRIRAYKKCNCYEIVNLVYCENFIKKKECKNSETGCHIRNKNCKKDIKCNNIKNYVDNSDKIKDIINNIKLVHSQNRSQI